MFTFEYTITDPVGVHARPAGLLVKFTGTLTSKVTVTKAGKEADGQRLFALMGLGAKCGETLTFTTEGEQETSDGLALEAFCRDNL